MADLDAIRGAVSRDVPRVREELERLVRIPSVSAPGFDPAAVQQSAEASAEILAGAGLDARLASVENAHPAVVGGVPAPKGAPTVLLYAHHDVQPAGALDRWSSPPFEPVEREGRLYGRGTCDDKAGIVVHAAALRAWDGRPPVGVKVFIEGEEEVGSTNLAAFLERHLDDLRADVIVLADASNWRTGHPALTTSLRGLVDCVVEVRVLDHAVHSGMYGGPVPDALTVMARMLASLHDERGRVAIPGLASGPAEPLDLTDEEYRGWVGARSGVRLIGEGGLTERLWTRPAAAVLGIDAPSVRDASNQIVPSARAKVSLRLAPGDDPSRAASALADHLRRHAPWGAEVTITPGAAAEPHRIDSSGPAYDSMRRAMGEAWGREPADIGAGGTIPFVAAFARAFPDAAIMLTGMEDPRGNAHAEDESIDVLELERACLAEALFLGYLAEP